MSGSSRWFLFAALLLLAQAMPAQPVHPDIRINNSTGVNGQASGAPGGQAAVFLPLGCATVGASTTIQAPAHGMGGFPTDGSSALWLNTAAGRRWTQVTGFPNGDTITVEDSFNIGVAVDCAMGGEIAGALANVTRLCPDVKAGWTLTLEETGTPYTDSGVCTLTSGFTSTNSEGVILLQGDNPDTPTPILYGTNGNYIGMANNVRAYVRNLQFIKNTGGGTLGQFANQAFLAIRNVIVSNSAGTWTQAFAGPLLATPGVVLLSQAYGPFTASCADFDDSDLLLANYLDGCSGSTLGINAGGAFMGLYNIIDQQGSTNNIIAGTVNNGAGGFILYNTLLGGGGNGLSIGANYSSLAGGNLVGDAAGSSGACYNAGTNAAALLGSVGQPSNLWLGNASNSCPTARYGGGLATSPQGAATDLAAGAAVDPLFRDAPNLDFFPTSAELKSSTVYPGAAFPFLTPALPVSTTTAGAAQRAAGAGVAAYGYSGP